MLLFMHGCDSWKILVFYNQIMYTRVLGFSDASRELSLLLLLVVKHQNIFKHWFKHILFVILHQKRLGRAKKNLCLVVSLHCYGLGDSMNSGHISKTNRFTRFNRFWFTTRVSFNQILIVSDERKCLSVICESWSSSDKGTKSLHPPFPHPP